MALVLTVSDLFLRINVLCKYTDDIQKNVKQTVGFTVDKKNHNQKMDGHTQSSLMPSDLDPILRLHLVNDTIPLVSVKCQNQYTRIHTMPIWFSPETLDQWFPRGRKTAGCWHILLLSSRSQLCYDYQSPLWLCVKKITGIHTSSGK